MKIESLSIREGMMAKTFRFSEGRTVIYSNKHNSVGKTTLIRCLLYALGEEVPGTQHFHMNSHSMRLVLSTDQGERLKLLRDESCMRIINIGNGSLDSYTLPYDIGDVKRRVYGADSPELTSNILGAFYIDQDKGWSLLNRGKVISGIRFNIEELLRGLSGIDCTFLTAKRQQLKSDIEKYSFIVKAAGYQEEVIGDPGVFDETPTLQKNHELLAELRMKELSLRKRKQAIRRAQRDNKRFAEHITTLGLRIRLPNGEELRITADNLVDYDDTRGYLEGEAISLSAERAEIIRQIQTLEATIAEQDTLFQVEKSSLSFDRQIAEMKLDIAGYQNALDSLKKQKADVDSQLRAAVSPGQPAYDMMNAYVVDYCTQLGIERTYLDDARGLLTSDLKSKSGTNYQLLVFAFRLAYASTIREMKGINLPLIIDSIRRGETSSDNLAKCFGLLSSSMSEHQQIIVTIDNNGIDTHETILIENAMMDGGEFVTDIAAWENGE